MAKYVLRSIGLGIAGLVLGCLIVWFAAAMWNSIDQRWIATGMLLPLAGLWIGLYLFGPPSDAERRKLRAVLFGAAVLLGTTGNYLAFVIASRTWSMDRVPTEEQSLAYQATHPNSLRTFTSRRQGIHDSEETWREYAAVGLVGSPIIFWIFTREPKARKK
jgi:hypothetical protein